MSWHQILKYISDIPEGKYEGYMWISNENKPCRITGPTELAPYHDNGTPCAPFIMEAHFYSKAEDLSISIRHVSGKYIVNRFFLKDFETQEHNLVLKKFIAHKNLGKDLYFKEIWRPEKDENCEGMEMLKKQAVVFAGFKMEVK